MKYIATRDLRSNPSAVWKTLDEGSEVIVTVNGKPKAIMIRADEDLEFLIKAIARAKAELAVERMRLQSLKNKGKNGTDSIFRNKSRSSFIMLKRGQTPFFDT
ncbi:type II toxin-antitoxin system Phd/YefM family antitoxin [Mesotoga sp. B105.6.4]|uniref:type II toxin-antitoxin system Phd/YefM family antitoxin n=1 Tax=Mesotoga sp. B105.6.4 TaxID=1582224 RepID=UPI000CCF07FD|nr:type II toxin-antitoxin system Phd/YefM family antitoxin [Mesotoga sp. B105.6.4]PNS40983.1 hypothetical protein RJ60_05620 [Mesotoga sp. B105.6.4]